MDRRRFLQGAGKAALSASAMAAILAACAPKATPNGDGAGGVSPTPGSGSAWDALASDLQGTLLRPGDSGYVHAVQIRNILYQDTLPAGVAVVANAQDIATCIGWAREEGIPFTTRSGGHSFGGYSTSPGLVINLSGMTGATVDESTGQMTTTGAALNKSVTTAGQPVNMSIAGGQCPGVGIAGLTLGGGLGFYMRKHGLTIDALRETEIVLADGRVITCNEQYEPDLFWALRGGGGGNFGINTSFTFDAFEVPPMSTIYNLIFDADDAPAAFRAFEDLLPDAPGDLSVVARFFVSPAGSDDPSPQLKLFGQLLDGTEDDLRELLAPVLAVGTPTTEQIQQMDFWGAKAFLAGTVGPPSAFSERSLYVPGNLEDGALDAIVRASQRWPGTADDSSIQSFFGWGGAVADVAPDATAFAHRSDLWLVAFDTSWSLDEDESHVSTLLQWQNDLWEEVRGFTSDRSYVNFIDPLLEDPMPYYYGSALDRLQQAKAKYDPDNIFVFPQSIPLPA